MGEGRGAGQSLFETWRDRCVQRGAETGVCSPAAAAAGALNWTGHLGDTLARCRGLMGTGVTARRPRAAEQGRAPGSRAPAAGQAGPPGESRRAPSWPGRAAAPCSPASSRQGPPGNPHSSKTSSPSRCPSGRKGPETTGAWASRNRFGALRPEKGVEDAGEGGLPPQKHVHGSQL